MIITLMIAIGARERHRRHRDARDERRDDARGQKYRRIGLVEEIRRERSRDEVWRDVRDSRDLSIRVAFSEMSPRDETRRNGGTRRE